MHGTIIHEPHQHCPSEGFRPLQATKLHQGLKNIKKGRLTDNDKHNYLDLARGGRPKVMIPGGRHAFLPFFQWTCSRFVQITEAREPEARKTPMDIFLDVQSGTAREPVRAGWGGDGGEEGEGELGSTG